MLTSPLRSPIRKWSHAPTAPVSEARLSPYSFNIAHYRYSVTYDMCDFRRGQNNQSIAISCSLAASLTATRSHTKMQHIMWITMWITHPQAMLQAAPFSQFFVDSNRSSHPFYRYLPFLTISHHFFSALKNPTNPLNKAFFYKNALPFLRWLPFLLTISLPFPEMVEMVGMVLFITTKKHPRRKNQTLQKLSTFYRKSFPQCHILCPQAFLRAWLLGQTAPVPPRPRSSMTIRSPSKRKVFLGKSWSEGYLGRLWGSWSPSHPLMW